MSIIEHCSTNCIQCGTCEFTAPQENIYTNQLFTKAEVNTYILLDGLVFSIVGYFYKSRCILASP